MRYPPHGTDGFIGPAELRPLIKRIFERYPAARDFQPCECGLTLGIVPISEVRDHHMIIDDAELRAEASELIRSHHLPNANREGGVLILGERA